MPADSATRIVRALTLAVLTGLALYFCFLMMAPFLSAFTWAFALAAVCSPLRKWLNARIPKLLATLLILAAIIIAVSLPGAIVARELLQESARAQQLLQRSIQGGGWQSAIEAHPWIADVLEWADDRLDVSQLGQQIAIVMSR